MIFWSCDTEARNADIAACCTALRSYTGVVAKRLGKLISTVPEQELSQVPVGHFWLPLWV